MSGEGFLSRWSRRKRAVEAGAPVEEPQAAPAPAEAATPVAGVASTAAEPVEPPFDLASLPSIESLTAESDFAAFLHKAVPEALRRAALRKAWALDPAIRDFVGLADYAWDYNAPDGVPGAALHLSGDVKGMVARLFADAEGAPAEALPVTACDAAPAMAPEATAAPEQESDRAEPGPPEAEGGEGPAVTPLAIAGAPVPDAVEFAPAAPRRHGSALPS